MFLKRIFEKRMHQNGKKLLITIVCSQTHTTLLKVSKTTKQMYKVKCEWSQKNIKNKLCKYLQKNTEVVKYFCEMYLFLLKKMRKEITSPFYIFVSTIYTSIGLFTNTFSLQNRFLSIYFLFCKYIH